MLWMKHWILANGGTNVNNNSYYQLRKQNGTEMRKNKKVDRGRQKIRSAKYYPVDLLSNGDRDAMRQVSRRNRSDCYMQTGN